MIPHEIKRVLVALDSEQSSQDFLASATALAARLQAELFGLFIEDVDLLNFAGLRIGREVTRSTGQFQATDISAMEQSLRQQAKRLQSSMASLATQQKVPYQFLVRRGERDKTISAESRQGDLLVIRRSVQYRPQGKTLSTRQSLLLQTHIYNSVWIPPGKILENPVVTVFDGSSTAQQALQLAAYIASHDGQQIKVILLGDADHSIGELQQQAFTLMQDYGLQDASFLPSHAQDLEKLTALLRKSQARLWLLPRKKDWSPEWLQQLIAQADCPVLLVNE